MKKPQFLSEFQRRVQCHGWTCSESTPSEAFHLVDAYWSGDFTIFQDRARSHGSILPLDFLRLAWQIKNDSELAGEYSTEGDGNLFQAPRHNKFRFQNWRLHFINAIGILLVCSLALVLYKILDDILISIVVLSFYGLVSDFILEVTDNIFPGVCKNVMV